MWSVNTKLRIHDNIENRFVHQNGACAQGMGKPEAHPNNSVSILPSSVAIVNRHVGTVAKRRAGRGGALKGAPMSAKRFARARSGDLRARRRCERSCRGR